MTKVHCDLFMRIDYTTIEYQLELNNFSEATKKPFFKSSTIYIVTEFLNKLPYNYTFDVKALGSESQ